MSVLISKLPFRFFLCALLLSGPVGARAAPAYRPGEVLVKFRQEASVVGIRQVLAARSAAQVTSRIHRVQLNPGETVEQVVTELNALPEVEYAQPNYVSKVQLIPNDPRFDQQWSLLNQGISFNGIPGDADVRATPAWDLTTGSKNIIVAVIDSGVDLKNPDLRDNLWQGPKGAAGFDFVDQDTDPQDECGHGTAVAGVLGARGDNGAAIAGVSWQVSMMVLRAFKIITDGDGNQNCEGDTADIVSAIEYAISHGARVINASFGKYEFDQLELDAIDDARRAGILFVAAACNDSLNNDINTANQTPCYPASYNLPNVISVAATDHTDALISESNYGSKSVDLGAPGYNILTFLNTGDGSLRYTVVSGTSISTAFVSGAAALLLARNPTLLAPNLRTAILTSVDPSVNLTNVVASGGRLNIAAALQTTAATTVQSTTGSRGGGGGAADLRWMVMLVPILVLSRIPVRRRRCGRDSQH